jgi:cell division protein FtsB
MTYTKNYTSELETPAAAPVDIAAAQRERRERRAQALKARRRKVKAAKAEAEKARRSFITGRRFILICVTASVVFFVGSSAFRIVELKTQEKEAAGILQAKAEQQARLESELSMLNDKEYIEEQARERLGMVKPGEVVYVFGDAGVKDGAGTAEAAKDDDAGAAEAAKDDGSGDAEAGDGSEE